MNQNNNTALLTTTHHGKPFLRKSSEYPDSCNDNTNDDADESSIWPQKSAMLSLKLVISYSEGTYDSFKETCNFGLEPLTNDSDGADESDKESKR